MSRRTSWAAAIVIGAAAAGIAQELPPYRQNDQSVTALSILPPGQGAHANLVETIEFNAAGERPKHNDDQLGLYSGLIQAAPGLTDAELPNRFKDHSFGIPAERIERVYSPRPGATVARDTLFGVPHVWGDTREDVAFAAGYVTAEDRLFVMDVVRHLARGRLSELLGASESNLALDRGQQAVMDYSEAEIAALGSRLLALDPVLGATVLADLEAYTEGVNARIVEALTDPEKLPAVYPALQTVPKPWSVNDCLAVTTLVGGLFSPGGAGQLANDLFLSKLEAHFVDPAVARAVFDDFRRAEDPEAPTTVDTPFPFNDALGPVSPAAVARPDDPAAVLAAFESFGSPATLDTPLGTIPFSGPGLASNALLVGPTRSASGNALAVMGPQIRYWTPEVVIEMELHGPGIDAGGIGVPGMGPALIIGRGRNHAWSLTTAIADHQDIRAVRLCADETHYLDDGTCKAMETRIDVWLAKPSAGGIPAEPSPNRIVMRRNVERTRHGMVVARGTVDGAPAAFVRARSSYGKDADALLSWTAAMDPARTATIQDLRDAFRFFTLSFNVFLIHGDSIGYVLAGRYPKLAPGVDPDLVFWGDSAWDWQGTLAFAEHPQVIDPPQGWIVNWNNKHAPRFRSADSYHSFGPVHRSELLADGVAADPSMTLAELVRVMQLAATQDLRGVKVWPVLQHVLAPPVGTPRLDQALSLLDAWANAGAHRRDLDGDGNYDHAAAVALMDAWWSHTLRAVFEPAIGADAFDAVPTVHDNAPGPSGSAYASGWYGILHKDLRGVLAGAPIADMSRLYCGEGVLADCRARLRASLAEALDDLEARYGADPAGWDAQEERDRLAFTSVGLIGQPRIDWQNRPTYQQVLELP